METNQLELGPTVVCCVDDKVIDCIEELPLVNQDALLP